MAEGPACTCPVTDPVERATRYTVRHLGLEPHAAGCPRHGLPKVPADDVAGRLREAGAMSSCGCCAYVPALSPVVEAIAEERARQRAAEELDRVVAEVACDPRMQIYVAMLEARAAALRSAR